MNLEYKILWFEDSEDWYEAILPDVSEFLTDNGFTLIANRKDDGSDISEIFKNDNYDLILMDYNLVGGEIGDTLIDQIRQLGIYIDVIFYSQKGEKTVRNAMKEKGLDGVFCASRSQDEFLDKVQRVIKTTIKKVVDLNNIRGLVMASTSALDIQMEEAISKMLDNLPTNDSKKHKSIVKEKFMESLNGRLKKVKAIDEINDFENLLVTVESSHKWRATCRLCDTYENLSQYTDILKDYDKEIIARRNLLAHVTEEIDNTGNKTLKSRLPGKEPYVFNEAEAINVRNDLRKYAEVLNKIIENF